MSISPWDPSHQRRTTRRGLEEFGMNTHIVEPAGDPFSDRAFGTARVRRVESD